MLSDLLTEDLVQFDVVASNWEDAIRKSAQPLVDNKKVTEGYVDDIIMQQKIVKATLAPFSLLLNCWVILISLLSSKKLSHQKMLWTLFTQRKAGCNGW